MTAGLVSFVKGAAYLPVRLDRFEFCAVGLVHDSALGDQCRDELGRRYIECRIAYSDARCSPALGSVPRHFISGALFDRNLRSIRSREING